MGNESISCSSETFDRIVWEIYFVTFVAVTAVTKLIEALISFAGIDF